MDDPTPDAELQTLVDEIDAAGLAGDAVTQTLAKGLVGGFNKMLELLKGHKGSYGKPAKKTKGKTDQNVLDDDDTDAVGGEGGEETDTDESGDGDGGRDQDMMMAQQPDGFGGGVIQPDGTLDVTQHVKGTFESLQSLHKGRVADQKLLVKAVKQQKALTEALQAHTAMMADFISAHVEVQVPLVKAVIDMREELHLIPEPVHTPRGRPGRRPSTVVNRSVTVDNAKLIGGNKKTEGLALLKARRTNIIDEGQRRQFHLDRTFSADEAENTAIRERVAGTLTA